MGLSPGLWGMRPPLGPPSGGGSIPLGAPNGVGGSLLGGPISLELGGGPMKRIKD